MKTLIEGMKSVGKTTHYDPVDITKEKLIRNLHKDYIVDRMFIKEYVYNERGLHDTILTTMAVFDKIVIVIPKDFKEYEIMFKDRIYNDFDFKLKMDKCVHNYNFHKGVDKNFETFNKISMKRYLKVIRTLKHYCKDVEVFQKSHNIDVLEFTFYINKESK